MISLRRQSTNHTAADQFTCRSVTQTRRAAEEFFSSCERRVGSCRRCLAVSWRRSAGCVSGLIAKALLRTLLPSTLKEMFKQRPGSGDTQIFLIVLLSIQTGDDPDRVPASGSAPVHRDLHLTDHIQSLKELKMKENLVSQRPLRGLISRSLFSGRASC